MTLLFFLSNVNFITEVIQIFEHFSFFSGLKPNKSKCEIIGIGVLKGIQMALCGMKFMEYWEFIFHVTEAWKQPTIENLAISKVVILF